MQALTVDRIAGPVNTPLIAELLSDTKPLTVTENSSSRLDDPLLRETIIFQLYAHFRILAAACTARLGVPGTSEASAVPTGSRVRGILYQRDFSARDLPPS